MAKTKTRSQNSRASKAQSARKASSRTSKRAVKRTSTPKGRLGPKAPKPAARTEALARLSPRSKAAAASQVVTKRARSGLGQRERKKYFDLLIVMRNKATNQISFLSSDSLNKPGYDIPPDSGTDDFDRDFGLSLLSSEHDILFEINEALVRIDDKSYGRCQQCSEPISRSRLEALPFARMCVACQSQLEKSKPRFHPLGQTLASGEARTANAEPQAAGEDQ